MPGTMASVQPQPATTAEPTDSQQLVSFSFYRLDPAWRRLPASTKAPHAKELLATVERYTRRLLVRSYSLVGLKPDVDFLLWRVSNRLELLQEMSSAIIQTKLGGYLSTPYSFLSMTKRSTYVDKLDPEHQDRRRFITPGNSTYLFVYPFAKTREWYQLPLEQRQAMMDEHIAIGNRYPSVRLHTTYSFGLDDQEFVVAFESDKPHDFLDLVMELRETESSKYTVRDTPVFTCVMRKMDEILESLG